jgi:Fe-S cluster biogenesis protein NfuA/nitrite reductase/ring-hydroxylating ferredoxin subunit
MNGRDLIARVQELTAELQSVGDEKARRCGEELTAAVVEMYGDGLERIMDALEAAPLVRDRLVEDPVVASLLLIHDLYPVPLEQRVAEALDRVRPYMESHGGDVELLGIEDGVARLRLQGSCSSCQASSATLELAVRQALEELAPDLEGMDVEGIEEPAVAGIALPMASAQPANGDAQSLGSLVSLPLAGEPGGGAPSWFDVDGVAGLAPEELVAALVHGERLVIANVDGTLLAYRNACASCGGDLDGGVLSSGALMCPGCGRSYFLPRAGRSLDDDRLQLAPVPLLRDNGSVRVALAS